MSSLPFIVLLGGQDLEMQEIARLLSQHQVIFFDKSLRWDNALLSAYSNILSNYVNTPYHIYGIELKTDLTLPSNYPTLSCKRPYGKNKL